MPTFQGSESWWRYGCSAGVQQMLLDGCRSQSPLNSVEGKSLGGLMFGVSVQGGNTGALLRRTFYFFLLPE